MRRPKNRSRRATQHGTSRWCFNDDKSHRNYQTTAPIRESGETLTATQSRNAQNTEPQDQAQNKRPLERTSLLSARSASNPTNRPNNRTCRATSRQLNGQLCRGEVLLSTDNAADRTRRPATPKDGDQRMRPRRGGMLTKESLPKG